MIPSKWCKKKLLKETGFFEEKKKLYQRIIIKKMTEKGLGPKRIK